MGKVIKLESIGKRARRKTYLSLPIMKKYEYKVILIKIDKIWTGRAETDYLEALNFHGQEGWEFAGFVPTILVPKGVKGQELLLKRELPEY